MIGIINFITEREPKSPVSESYRMLRTNIQYSSIDKEIKIIAVTSSGPSEGKSTTSGNLALTFAQEDKKVLLIDCDLRKPVLHKRFNLSNKEGLSECIIGKSTLEECIVEYKKNMYILSSGKIPPNPSELLSSNKMKSFLEKAKEHVDIIILDTPPVLAVTDAQILSTYVDGTVLVIASGQTEKEAAVKAKEKLVKVKANILGVVLTKVPVGKHQYHYYEINK